MQQSSHWHLDMPAGTRSYVKEDISTETINGNVYSKFLVQNFAKSMQIPYHICKKTKLVLTNGKEGRRTCDYHYTEQRVLIVENGTMGRRILLQSNMDPGSWFLVYRYDKERSRIHVD